MDQKRHVRKLAREFAISKKYHPDAYATKNVAKLIIEAYEAGHSVGSTVNDNQPSNFDNSNLSKEEKDD